MLVKCTWINYIHLKRVQDWHHVKLFFKISYSCVCRQLVPWVRNKFKMFKIQFYVYLDVFYIYFWPMTQNSQLHKILDWIYWLTDHKMCMQKFFVLSQHTLGFWELLERQEVELCCNFHLISEVLHKHLYLLLTAFGSFLWFWNHRTLCDHRLSKKYKIQIKSLWISFQRIL